MIVANYTAAAHWIGAHTQAPDDLVKINRASEKGFLVFRRWNEQHGTINMSDPWCWDGAVRYILDLLLTLHTYEPFKTSYNYLDAKVSMMTATSSRIICHNSARCVSRYGSDFTPTESFLYGSAIMIHQSHDAIVTVYSLKILSNRPPLFFVHCSQCSTPLASPWVPFHTPTLSSVEH